MFESMPTSDDQHHRLNARQRREIDQIGHDWEYSDLDIVDRREIKHLAAENFWPYIGKSEVPLEELATFRR
jgi:hypothetical protein